MKLISGQAAHVEVLCWQRGVAVGVAVQPEGGLITRPSTLCLLQPYLVQHGKETGSER